MHSNGKLQDAAMDVAVPCCFGCPRTFQGHGFLGDIEDLVQLGFDEIWCMVGVIHKDVRIHFDEVSIRVEEELLELEWQEALGNNVGTLDLLVEILRAEDIGEVLAVEAKAWYRTGRDANSSATISLKRQRLGLLVDVAAIDPDRVGCRPRRVRAGEMDRGEEADSAMGGWGSGFVDYSSMMLEASGRLRATHRGRPCDEGFGAGSKAKVALSGSWLKTLV